MQKHGVLINDLHQLSSSLDASLFRKRGDVHYTPQGSALLGQQVADHIGKALGIKK